MDEQKREGAGGGDGTLGSVRFARLGQLLSGVARENGLTAPSFRSPPRQPGLRRSLQRRADGSCAVAVAVRSRPAPAVVADMIDGVLAVNDGSLPAHELAAVRDELWAAAASVLYQPADVSTPGGVVTEAGVAA